MRQCTAIFLLLSILVMLSGCGISQQMSKDCGGDLELGCKHLFGDSSESKRHEEDQNEAISINNSEISNTNATLAALGTRVSALELQMGLAISNIEILSAETSILHSSISSLHSSMSAADSGLQIQIDSLGAGLTSNAFLISNLQSQMSTQGAALSSQIASLQAGLNATNGNVLVMQSQANSTQAQMTVVSTQISNLSTQISALNAQDSVIDYLDCGGNGPGYDEVVLRTKSGKLVAYFESGSQRFLSILTPGNYQTTDASSCPFTVSAQMQFCDSLGCR